MLKIADLLPPKMSETEMNNNKPRSYNQEPKNLLFLFKVKYLWTSINIVTGPHTSKNLFTMPVPPEYKPSLDSLSKGMPTNL